MNRTTRQLFVAGIIFELLIFAAVMQVAASPPASALAQIPSLEDISRASNTVNLFNFVVAAVIFMFGGSIILNHRAQLRQAAAHEAAVNQSIQILGVLLQAINTITLLKVSIDSASLTNAQIGQSAAESLKLLTTAHETMLRTESNMRFETTRLEGSIKTFTDQALGELKASLAVVVATAAEAARAATAAGIADLAPAGGGDDI